MHQDFLVRIKAILLNGCQPIVITDAGFRSSWFRVVESLDWHWVGRIRNRDLVREHDKACASRQHRKSLYAKAPVAALDLGLFDWVRNHPDVRRLIKVAGLTHLRVTRVPEKSDERLSVCMLSEADFRYDIGAHAVARPIRRFGLRPGPCLVCRAGSRRYHASTGGLNESHNERSQRYAPRHYRHG